MLKEVTIRDFCKELLERIENAKDINCCQEELRTFAEYVVEKLGDDKIEINWKD